MIKTYSKDGTEEVGDIDERENLAGESTDDLKWQPEQRLDTDENGTQEFEEFVEDR